MGSTKTDPILSEPTTQTEVTALEPILSDDENSVDVENKSPVVTMIIEPESIMNTSLEEQEHEEDGKLSRVSLEDVSSDNTKDEVTLLEDQDNKKTKEDIQQIDTNNDLEGKVDEISSSQHTFSQPQLMSGGNSPRGLSERDTPSFDINLGLKMIMLVCHDLTLETSSEEKTEFRFKVSIGGLTMFESELSSNMKWGETHIPTGLTGNQLGFVEQLHMNFEVSSDVVIGSSDITSEDVKNLNAEFVKRQNYNTDVQTQQIKLKLINNKDDDENSNIFFIINALFDLEMASGVAVGKSAKGLRQIKTAIPVNKTASKTVTSRLAKMVPRSARRALKFTVLDAKPLGNPGAPGVTTKTAKTGSSLLSRFTETVVQMKFQTPWGRKQGKTKGRKSVDKMRQSVETSAAEIVNGSVASWRQSTEGTLTLPLKEQNQTLDDDSEDDDEEEEDEYDYEDYEEDDDELLEYASNGLATSFQRSDLNKTVVVDLMGRRSGATDVLIGSTETTLREILRNSVSLDPSSSLNLEVAPEHASSLSILCDDDGDLAATTTDIPLQWALSYDASMVLCDNETGSELPRVSINQDASLIELEQEIAAAQEVIEPILVPAYSQQQQPDHHQQQSSQLQNKTQRQDPAETMFNVPDSAQRSIAKKKANELARRRRLTLNKSAERVPDVVWQAQRKLVRPPAWRSETLSAQLIQRRYRGFIVRYKMKKQRIAVTTISRYWRGIRDRKLVLKMKNRVKEIEQYAKETSERKIRRLRLEADMKKLKATDAAELAAIRNKDMEQSFKDRDEMLKKNTDAFLAVSKIRLAEEKEANTASLPHQQQKPLDDTIEKLEKEAINVLRSGRVSKLATRRAIGVSRTHMSEKEKASMGDLGSLYHRVDAKVRARKENQTKGEVYHDLFEARKHVARGFSQRKNHVDWEQKKEHLKHTRKLMDTLHDLPSLASIRKSSSSSSSSSNKDDESKMDLLLRPPTDPDDLEACHIANTRTLDALRAERKNQWWSAVLPEDLSGTPRDVRESVEDPWEASLWWYGWARKITSVNSNDGTRKVTYVDFHGDSVSQADLLRRWQELGVDGRKAVASLQNKTLDQRAQEWAVAICDEVWRQRRLVIGPRQLDDLITRKKEILTKAATTIQQCWREHSKRMKLLRAATQDKVINALSLLVNAVAGASGTHVQESMLRNLADDLVSNVSAKPTKR